MKWFKLIGNCFHGIRIIYHQKINYDAAMAKGNRYKNIDCN
jgi:hypothetical protein